MDTKTSFWPSPFNVVLLFVVWILLTNSFSVGNLLLAALLAFLIPMGVARVQSETIRVKKPGKALRYLMVLIIDIITSNVIVAKQVLGSPDKLRPGFIEVPLDIKEPLPMTLLASTISLTPGTVSTEVSADRKRLYVHALHVPDEQALIAQIKTRYEAPLKEIFGC